MENVKHTDSGRGPVLLQIADGVTERLTLPEHVASVTTPEAHMFISSLETLTRAGPMALSFSERSLLRHVSKGLTKASSYLQGIERGLTPHEKIEQAVAVIGAHSPMSLSLSPQFWDRYNLGPSFPENGVTSENWFSKTLCIRQLQKEDIVITRTDNSVVRSWWFETPEIEENNTRA